MLLHFVNCVAMILLALVLVLVISLYIFNKYHYSYWKRRGIPGPDALPLVGNLLDTVLLRKTLSENVDDYYKKYNNVLYFGIFKFSKPTLLIRDANTVKRILTTDFKYFCDNDFHVDHKHEIEMGKSFFFSKGAFWKRFRTLINPFYSAKKIRMMYPTMMQVCNNFVEYLRTHGNETPAGVDIREAVGRFTTDVIYRSAFSIKSDGLSNPKSMFFYEQSNLFQKTTKSALALQITWILPPLARILKLRAIPKATLTWLRNLVNASIDSRKVNDVDDFLSSILQLKDKLNDYDFTMEDIVAHTIPFLTDGFETSSYAISFALFEIAANPDVQDKVRQEIEEVVGLQGDLTYESLLELKYLECVINETMRKYPVEAGFMKSCTKEYIFPPIDGDSGLRYTMKPGESVLLSLHSLHLDPKYFPDPPKFDPERFRDEVAMQRHKNAFLPFGDGPRMCIGYRFALAQAKCCIANLVRNFDISVAEGMKKHLELDKRSLFAPYVKGGCWLRFSSRENAQF